MGFSATRSFSDLANELVKRGERAQAELAAERSKVEQLEAKP